MYLQIKGCLNSEAMVKVNNKKSHQTKVQLGDPS